MAKHNPYTELFKRLRNYLISPHLNIWKALRKRLFDKNFPEITSQLKDFTQPPPAELFDRVLEKHHALQSDSQFAALSHLQVPPPDNAFDHILSTITKQSKEKPGIIRSIPVYKKMIAAAILAGIVLCGVLFLTTIHEKEGEGTPGIVNNAGTAPAAEPVKDSLQENGSSKDKPLLASHKRMHQRFFNASNYLSFKNASIGDISIPIQDDDLLFSFASYPYRLGKAINWNENKGTIVKINSYTAITISPYMSSVMADMYNVKKNGKLTYKARRAKARINQWKKTDSKRFSKRKNRNPLDIIDLAENVY